MQDFFLSRKLSNFKYCIDKGQNPMKRSTKTILISILLLLIFQPVFSQKVALVLSGGGSKGVSHVGVIRALEENNIPIDCIAGTSMGAIVGALYASGFTPDEMEALLISNDVRDWASGQIDKKYIYYFKNRKPDATMINIPFNIKKKIVSKLPTNIVSPYQMDFEFMEYFAGPAAAADYNFDSLFVPFRCVAAEIDSNKIVVFSSGQLSSAVRASMTYPFYFKPIEVNNKLLFDGGMYNNFPVDVAIKDFNPDIIIGSKAAGNYDSPLQDDIVSQLQNMLMENTNYSLHGKKGIIIEPNLPSVNVIDFSRSRAFIDSGYKSAIIQMPEIKKLINKRISGQELEKRRSAFAMKKPPLIIDSVYIDGLNKNQKVYFQRILMRRKHYTDINNLKKEYFKMVADNQVKFVYPRLRYNKKTGYCDLYLAVKRAERFIARFGGNISSTAANEAFVGLQYNFLGKNSTSLLANAYFGRFYSSFKINGRFDFATMTPFFMEVDMTYNHYDYFKNSTYFFEDKEPSFLIRNENYTSLSFGFPATNTGKLVTGASVGRITNEYYQINNFSRLDTADKTHFDVITPYIQYELNSLNRKQYATSGARFSLAFRYTNGIEKNIPGSTASNKDEYEKAHDFISFKLFWENYFHSFKWIKFGFYSEVYLSTQKLFNNYTATILSAQAFQPVPASKTQFLPNYRAHNYAGIGLINIIPIIKNFDLRVSAFALQPYRYIKQDIETHTAYYGKELSDRAYIGSASFIYYTPIGPISLSFNYFDRTHDRFSVMLNFGYLIFNESIFD